MKIEKMQIVTPEKQAGVSLNEFILYSGLAAIVIATAIAGFRFAKSGGDAMRTQQELASIRANASSLYQSAPDFTGIDMTTLKKAQALPDTLNTNGENGYTNAYGGQVKLEAAGTPALNAAVTYESVPVADCIKLLSSAGSGWSKIEVGTEKFDFMDVTKPVDFSVAKITEACTKTPTDGRQTMVFTFRK